MIISYILAIITFVLGVIHGDIMLFAVSAGFCFAGAIGEFALFSRNRRSSTYTSYYKK